MQHVQGQVTAERLLTQLLSLGVRISKGQIIALLNQDNAAFHAEKDAILEAGLATARWVTVDGPSGNALRAVHRRPPRPHQPDHDPHRRRPLRLVRHPPVQESAELPGVAAGRPDYVINAAAEAYMVEHAVPAAVIDALVGHDHQRFADQAAWEAHLASLDIGGRRRIVTEAALVGAITAHGLLSDTAIVSDDAGQFNVFTHALCWIHAERHLRRLVCVTDEQRRLVAVQRHLVWWYFRDLKAYKADPTPERRTALRQRFERVFGRVTGFTELDDTVARLRANKDELLLVLVRPEIPLHTNGSERDIRCCVTRRKISGETRAEAGKQARDTFLSLLKTGAKLGVSFWDYLGARLKIPDASAVPWLPDLVRQPAAA